MKLITAVVQPHRLPRIRAAARRMPGFPGMTIDKVEGFSVDSEPAPIGASGIKRELTEYSPKVRLTVLAPDESVDPIVRMITDICHSGEKGDGLVWVHAVDRHVRIRDVPRDLSNS